MEPSRGADKKTVLFVTILPAFLIPFMGSSVHIALPSIGREFHMSAVSLSWIATAYLLSTGIFLVPFGRVADIHGRKKVFLWGVSLYTLSSLLTVFSGSAMELIACRILQGIGAAMTFGTSVAILTSAIPAHERGKALGINVAATYSGLSLGPFLGGILTQHMGWRSIFWLNIPMGVLILCFTRWKLKGDWAEARGERLDWKGSVVYGLSLTALICSLTLLPALSGALLGGAGILGILCLIRYESKAETPIFNMDLFRKNRVFAFSNLAALINYSATFAVSFLLSLYLQYTKGFSPQEAGFILIAQPVMQALFSPLAGRLSDRIEPRVIASLGMALTGGGLFLLATLSETTSILFLTSCLVLLGLGFAFFSSPNVNAAMSSIENRFYGIASGIIGTTRVIGMMFSMGVVTVIFSLSIGGSQIGPEHYPLFLRGARAAFILFAFLCLGGLWASMVRGKIRP